MAAKATAAGQTRRRSRQPTTARVSPPGGALCARRGIQPNPALPGVGPSEPPSVRWGMATGRQARQRPEPVRPRAAFTGETDLNYLRPVRVLRSGGPRSVRSEPAAQYRDGTLECRVRTGTNALRSALARRRGGGCLHRRSAVLAIVTAEIDRIVPGRITAVVGPVGDQTALTCRTSLRLYPLLTDRFSLRLDTPVACLATVVEQGSGLG
jgi:hypothetical protein